MLSIKALLKIGDLRPKKAFGQNFLQDLASCQMIVRKANLKASDTVLEIGPGLGTLTLALASTAQHVIAVEKDTALIPLLKMQLEDAHLLEKVDVIEGDILRFSIADAFAKLPHKGVVCGNLPYNISSQVLVNLIENRQYISKAVLMFQKELAQRIAAPPGKKDYGRISAMLQYCADVRSLAVLKPQSFFPAPQVDSEVVEIVFKENPAYPSHDEKLLYRVIKGAFGNRRKTLRNSLSAGGLGLMPNDAAYVLEKSSINPERRAETLSPFEFVNLTVAVEEFLHNAN